MSVLESPGIYRQQNRFLLDSLKGRETADLCHMYASGQWYGLGYTSEQHVQGPCWSRGEVKNDDQEAKGECNVWII